MVTIKNSEICVKIAKKGAEIQSVKRGDTEYMWNDKNPEIWPKTAPIMFPICGGLKNGRYELDSTSYEMPRHGFARISDFAVENQTDTSVTFILYDNEETRKMYPFTFAFRVKYELDSSSLKVTYDAENLDSKTMYFSFGGHEAYACPEGIEAYELIFPEKEMLYAYTTSGELLTSEKTLIVDNSERLILDDKYFEIDALVFRNVKSNSAVLQSKSGSRRIKVEFDGFDYLVLWHKHKSPYLCIEPWCGIPDVVGSEYDIAKKEGIHALSAGEHFARTHTITFN